MSVALHADEMKVGCAGCAFDPVALGADKAEADGSNRMLSNGIK